MADEAQLRLRIADPISFTILNSSGIEKGALCKMVDPRTAYGSAATDLDPAFAGIAAREKIASDGITNGAMFRRGIFDMRVASGASVSVGDWVSISGANTIHKAIEAAIASGAGVGIAMEAGSSDETINVMVGGY